MNNYICKDKIMMDGIILMLNSDKQKIYKLKTQKFYER